MAMTGVASRFAFFEVYFRRLLTRGENPRSGETTNPHFVRGPGIWEFENLKICRKFWKFGKTGTSGGEF